TDRAARNSRCRRALRDDLRLWWRIAGEESDTRRSAPPRPKARRLGASAADASAEKLCARGCAQWIGVSGRRESDGGDEPFIGGEHAGGAVSGVRGRLTTRRVAATNSRSSPGYVRSLAQ